MVSYLGVELFVSSKPLSELHHWLLPNEYWKDIIGHEVYQISSLGRVKSKDKRVKCSTWTRVIKGKILKPTNHHGGYLFASMRTNGKEKKFTRHRLVGIHSLPNPDNLPEINHIVNNKKHNAMWNLEWCTRLQNVRHSIDFGAVGVGENAASNKLMNFEVVCIKIMLACGGQQAQIAEIFNVSFSTISQISRGRIWKSVTV